MATANAKMEELKLRVQQRTRERRASKPIMPTAATLPVEIPKPIPREQWPRAARLIAWRKRDGETGVGDTLARILGNVGADGLAHWYEKITGHDCGCANRQAKLNAIFPYLKEG